MTELALKWDIANSCNLHCKHCGAAYYLDRAPVELELDELLRACDSIIACRFDHVVLLGGEPFILGDTLLRVTERLADGGVKVTITTNGTLINFSMAEKLIRSGVQGIIVSLDGEENACDMLRGKGVFSKSISGIQAFLSACSSNQVDPNIEINTVLNRYNFFKVGDLLPTLKQLRVKRWNIFSLVNVGRAVDNRDILKISESDLIDTGKALAHILAHSNWKPPRLTCGFLYPLSSDYIFYETGYKLGGTQHCCHAGLSYFYMDNSLRIFPCDRVRDQILNVVNVPRITDSAFNLNNIRCTSIFSDFMERIMGKASYERFLPCNKCEYLWEGQCIPCALTGEKSHCTVPQCIEILNRAPDLLYNHHPDCTVNPYFQQFFADSKQLNYPSFSATLDFSKPITLTPSTSFEVRNDTAFLISTISKELVKLTPIQSFILTTALQCNSLSTFIKEITSIFPHLTSKSLKEYIETLISLGLCEQASSSYSMEAL